MDEKLVSIITPSYNSKRFISQTIESVLAQTYENWEMLIVDDLSPDNSNEIIEEYTQKDGRIKLLKLEKNSGPAVARNRAIQEAKGRYIAFLDADDLWMPEKLEKQIAFMSEKKCTLSYSSYSKIDHYGKNLNQIAYARESLTYTELLKSNRIGCLTAIYDTKFTDKIYMPLIRKRQDYGLWLKILKQTDRAFGMNEILARYRILNNSISSNKFNLLKYNYELFREHEEFSTIKSLYYVAWNIYIKLLGK